MPISLGAREHCCLGELHKPCRKLTNFITLDKEIEDTESTRTVSYFYTYILVCTHVCAHTYVSVLPRDCFIGLSHVEGMSGNGVSHFLVDKEIYVLSFFLRFWCLNVLWNFVCGRLQ